MLFASFHCFHSFFSCSSGQSPNRRLIDVADHCSNSAISIGIHLSLCIEMKNRDSYRLYGISQDLFFIKISVDADLFNRPFRADRLPITTREIAIEHNHFVRTF